jgi:hypothetical protein
MKQSGEMSSAPSSAGGLPSSQGRGFDVFAGLLKDVKVKR